MQTKKKSLILIYTSICYVSINDYVNGQQHTHTRICLSTREKIHPLTSTHTCMSCKGLYKNTTNLSKCDFLFFSIFIKCIYLLNENLRRKYYEKNILTLSHLNEAFALDKDTSMIPSQLNPINIPLFFFCFHFLKIIYDFSIYKQRCFTIHFV